MSDPAPSPEPEHLHVLVIGAGLSGIDAGYHLQTGAPAASCAIPEARWRVTAVRSGTDEATVFTGGFLVSCTGYYRYDRGHTPDFDGTDKRIVVVGSGATAVTLVPALVETAAHVTMLQRSPTYVAAVPYRNPVARLLTRRLPERWSGPLVRWFSALGTQGFFRLPRRFPRLVRRILLKGVERALPAGYDIATDFTPRYDPWDQRLCADPEGKLFAAIGRGDASVVTDEIERFTSTGIRLRSGAELPADIVVTATGLELLFLGGMEIRVDGEPVDLSTRLVYRGMMLEGVPNPAMGDTNASWTLKYDLSCNYVP